MTNANLTHLVLILDRSGSMASGGKNIEAEKGVRALLDEQKSLPGQSLEVTVARFDEQYDLIALAKSPDSLAESDLAIEPRGMTALFDAVGRTVASVGENLANRPEQDRPGRVAVVVATDGLENASTEYSGARLKEIIDIQTDTYGWDFMFMGTSQEALLQARGAGFRTNSSYSSSDTAAGVGSSYQVASQVLYHTRSKGAGARVEVTDEDRKKLK